LWRCRRVRDHRMSCGCTCSTTISIPPFSGPGGATPAGFNQAVYERLKPGGFYVIVDHVAAAGTGTSHAESLHRIEPAAVREEVQMAGFVLDAESTVLANKDDPHSIKVFDPSIKGETDRFAYRFVRL
jgi:predicted methyltransferase